jgi:hypothetical protein
VLRTRCILCLSVLPLLRFLSLVRLASEPTNGPDGDETDGSESDEDRGRSGGGVG